MADTGNDVVRRIDANGVISTVAGTPLKPGGGGDGGPATSAKLNQPMGVADLGGGVFAIADTGNGVIRRVDANGTIVTLHTNSGFREPRALAPLEGGALLVADSALNRVFRLSATGIATTVAGTTTAGSGGDGGPATAAQLNRPTAVAVDATGDILIADFGNRRVRRIAPDGTITTVAGGGQGSATGVGAVLQPIAVGFAADGGTLIGDGAGVERVGSGGALQRIAGTGQPGFDVDSGDALAVSLNEVSAVVGTADGSVLISDSRNDRVRRLSGDPTVTTVAGSGRPPPPSAGRGPASPPSASVAVCRRLPAATWYMVSFTAYPPPILVRRTHGRGFVRLRLTADSDLRLIVRRGRHRTILVVKGLRTGASVVGLGNLSPGGYSLRAMASTPDLNNPPAMVYSCRSTTLRVR